jgi:hypothetical protein
MISPRLLQYEEHLSVFTISSTTRRLGETVCDGWTDFGYYIGLYRAYISVHKLHVD